MELYSTKQALSANYMHVNLFSIDTNPICPHLVQGLSVH